MKKGTVVLFAYSLFLMLAAIVATFSKDGSLGKIAVAATVAGYFLALSEEYAWFADESKDSIENLTEFTARFSEIEIEFNKRHYSDFGKEEYKAIHHDIMSEVDSSRNRLEKERKRYRRNSITSLCLMGIGILVFLFILSFQPALDFFLPLQETLTTCAFGIIVFLYAVREVKGFSNAVHKRNLGTLEKSLELLRKYEANAAYKKTDERITNTDEMQSSEPENEKQEKTQTKKKSKKQKKQASKN